MTQPLLPAHLGGHMNKTHVDRGALMYMVNEFNVESFLDVGCGPGGMVQLASDRGLKAMGIDGDFTIDHNLPVITHDFTTGALMELDDESRRFPTPWDLVWSVEFLEHVEERFIPHFMHSYQKGKYIIVTHAVPGQGGHHHVNCQEEDYWKNVFDQYGFYWSPVMTQKIREVSTMQKPFIQRTGLVFINRKFI